MAVGCANGSVCRLTADLAKETQTIKPPNEKEKVIAVKFAPKRDIHMFPYKAKTTGLIGRVLKFLYGRGKRA